MSFDAAQNSTGMCRPHKHGGVITSCDEPTSIGTENQYIYEGFVRRLAIALSILELLRHDKLPVSSREQRSREQTPSNVHVSLEEQNKGMS
jgi:hypothetical protein